MSLENIIEYFKLIGASYYKVFQILHNVNGIGIIKEPFCYHFFNNKDKEIGYYHPDLEKYLLFPEDRYREWSVEFFNDKSMSQKQYL